MHAFVEFECCFAQLSEWDQGLVGVNKVLMFVRSINRKERMTIGIKLKIKTVQMASSRTRPKSKEYADDMMKSGWGHCQPEHDPLAAVKRG